jgi:hypothetical protein
MWRLLPALLLPVGAGFAVTHWVWPDAGARPSRHLLRASLAVGCGLALSSCAFFLATVAWGPSRHVAVSADLALLVGAVALAWLGRRRSGASRETGAGAALPVEARGTRTALRVALGVTLAAAVAAFLLLSWVRPHGEWDAWAFWNLRARFLFAGRTHWRIAFDALAGPHPDYPMLLPGTVARIWLYVGRATVVAPVLVAMLFTFATVGVAAAVVAALRGEAQGMLAAIVLLSTAGFTAHGTMQYADVPLSFFVLATLALWWLYDDGDGRRWRVASFAGGMAGFAAWTKNEGLLFLLAIVAARLAVAVAGRRWRRSARELAAFAAGLAPVLAVVGYFKLRLAPPTLYLLGERLEIVRERVTDVTRYSRIGAALLGELRGFGDWVVSLAGLLLVYALLVGVRVARADRPMLAASALALAIVFAGYVGVFLLTVEALDNWLGAGLTRLLLHLWPSAVFVYWLTVRPIFEPS